MPERQYFVNMTAQDRVRLRFTTERGLVTHFTVQYELNLEGEARPIVRYDSAHGRPHRDLLDRHGETIEKTWMPEQFNLNEALTLASQDIRHNWERYREAYERRQP